MEEELRLGIGGPFHRVERAARLEPLRRQLVAATGVAWMPLIVLATIESLFGRDEPLLRDLSIHARLLIALPLFLVAERVLDRTCHLTLARLFKEGFVGDTERQRVLAILRAVERWRDSRWPETLLLAVAVVGGVGALAGWTAPAGVIHGVSESRLSAVRVWYALVSLPLSQFVFWRALFRWGLWVRVLYGLARMPLRLVPWHADRRGGIGFLKIPSFSYCAIVLFAVSCTLCAGWGTQIVREGARMATFRPLFYVFLLIGAVLAFAPLLAFVPQLMEARRRGRREFGALVTDYGRAFGERWMGGDQRGLLGTPDIQSLADLSDSYRQNVEGMVPFLFTGRDAVALFVISQLPAIPLLLTQQSAHEVLTRLLRLVTGGMPG
jgi:hypothetical protein